jgi:hypothetical protein
LLPATVLILALLIGPAAAGAAAQVTTNRTDVRKAFEDAFSPSTLSPATVRVPFTKQNGLIIVQAEVGGKVLPCVVDTGDPLIRWPKGLRLAGKATGIHATGTDVGGNSETHEMVLLSRVRLGAYELADVPSWAVGGPDALTDKASTPPDLLAAGAGGVWQRYPILGNIVFERVALTIDYQKSELVLRSSSSAPNARTLPVRRVGPVFTTGAGVARGGFVVIAGTVGGRPVNFVLDTGLPFEEGIVLAPNKRDLAAAQSSSRRDARAVVGLGQVATEQFAGVTWSLGGGVLGQGDVIVPSRFSLVGDGRTSLDALIGAHLLRAYRITIDYPRARVVLEPYSVKKTTTR